MFSLCFISFLEFFWNFIVEGWWRWYEDEEWEKMKKPYVF